MSAGPVPSSGACEICGQLRDVHTAYLDRDERLPAAARLLVDVPSSTPKDCDASLRRCPRCGVLYLYGYMPPGPGNVGDREDLERFRPLEMELIVPLLELTDPRRLGAVLERIAVAGDQRIRWRAVLALEHVLARIGAQAAIAALEPFESHGHEGMQRMAAVTLRRLRGS